MEDVRRWESPFRQLMRGATRDTTLGGVSIPAGAMVLMFWSAGNRDAAVFDRADEIDLARPRRNMTFGKGIHMCVGAPLARLEGQIVLRKLLARTRHIALDASRPPRWVSSLQVRRYEQLPICVIGSSRSEEHTSELQSLMRISSAVFCLKKKTQTQAPHTLDHTSAK